MNKRTWLLVGAVITGLILIVLLRPASQPAPVTTPVNPPTRPVVKFVHHLQRPLDELPAPSPLPVAQPSETNAASIYRQAFALYDALSPTNRTILNDWQTNVDAAVEAELCEQLRPICDLLHQASTVTNCDWGITPLDFDTKLPHLAAARNLGRAAIWCAAHCRQNEASAATDDLVATVRFGFQASQGGSLIGYLVNMSIQQMAWSYVAANVAGITAADGQRLAAAFDDPVFDDAISRALQQEAGTADRFAARLAAMTPAEAYKTVEILEGDGSGRDSQSDVMPVIVDGSLIAAIKAAADLDRDLARVMTTGSGSEYEDWLQRYDALIGTKPLCNWLLAAIPNVVTKAQGYEVNRALVEAGLAVAATGTPGLAKHLDPSTGQLFTYQEVPGGFELQSSFQFKNQPVKMFFPQSAAPPGSP